MESHSEMSPPPFKLGVEILLSDEPGSLITEVFQDSLAKRIGLVPGDVLFQINGTNIETVDDVEAVLANSNDVAMITYLRKSDATFRRIRIVHTYSANAGSFVEEIAIELEANTLDQM